MALETIPLPDARLDFDPHWLTATAADALFADLHAAIPWETHRLRIFGRELDSPRLSCWIGDPGAAYTYSRTRFEPRPWPPALAFVRARLQADLGAGFNSVLANLYRDGRDSMGWHSDDEPELGAEPVIASLSLGATRRFTLKRRADHPEPVEGRHASAKFAIELPHGSLFVMRGATQHHWRHALPRTAKPCGERLNLTFRRVRGDET